METKKLFSASKTRQGHVNRIIIGSAGLLLAASSCGECAVCSTVGGMIALLAFGGLVRPAVDFLRKGPKASPPATQN